MHCCCDTFLLLQMTSVFLVLSHVAAQASIVCVLCAFGSQTCAHCVLGVLTSLSCPLAIGSLSLEGVTKSEQGLTSTSAPPAFPSSFNISWLFPTSSSLWLLCFPTVCVTVWILGLGILTVVVLPMTDDWCLPLQNVYLTETLYVLFFDWFTVNDLAVNTAVWFGLYRTR